jgi:hypothetical protein
VPDEGIEDSDEIDVSVEASDWATVDEITREIEDEIIEEERLTRADINLGRFSISKV